MKSNIYHRQIGLSETQKGASLTIRELDKKTSLSEQENLKLSSRLVDMFASGQEIPDEDSLLDFLPLKSHNVIDFTQVEMLRNYARAEVQRQYGEYQNKVAKRRQAFAARNVNDNTPVTNEQLGNVSGNKPNIL